MKSEWSERTLTQNEFAKKSVGEIIREARQKKGMTQDALAVQLHVTPQAISKWETGQTAPDINLLIPLSKALGLGVDQLLGGDRRQDFEHRYEHASHYGPVSQLLVCEDALKEFPDDESFLYRRACCEFFLGKDIQTDQKRRRKHLNQAASLAWLLHQQHPDDDVYITLLTNAYVELGQREEARTLLSHCKNLTLVDNLLADLVLEGEEKIKLQQVRISRQVTGLYHRLLEYNTPESIAVAHGLLDITMGKEKHLHFGLLSDLYLAQAVFSLDANDMAGYEKHMMEAYETAEAHDRDIQGVDRYTAPLYDHIDNEYHDWEFSVMNELVLRVQTDRNLRPPCEAKRRMVEHHIHCRPLHRWNAPAYCKFCMDNVNEENFFNFSHTWDMTEEELEQFNDRMRTSFGGRYPMELHRKETERLIKEGIMSGYVACCNSHDQAVIVGYCNCGAKEKYKGMPDEWKIPAGPKGARVFAIMELLSAPSFCDCGLEEKLLTYTLEQAKERGFTHAQAFLWHSGFVYKDGSSEFGHFLALYTAMGFSIHADISDVHDRREYVLQKEL
ncbi:MAG: helix-turn-helix transcriptional regulator [Clostridia bacterium]|nr:helix-turn-helix transcriptional regulator [Clostridia bacterium]